MRRAAEAGWPSLEYLKLGSGSLQLRGFQGRGGGREKVVKVTPQPWGILGTQAPPRLPARARTQVGLVHMRHGHHTLLSRISAQAL